MEESESTEARAHPAARRGGPVIAAPIAGDGAPPLGSASEGVVDVALPHWSDPPTGQVPRVLVDQAAPGCDDPPATLAWRELDPDWDQDEPLAVLDLRGVEPVRAHRESLVSPGRSAVGRDVVSRDTPSGGGAPREVDPLAGATPGRPGEADPATRPPSSPSASPLSASPPPESPRPASPRPASPPLAIDEPAAPPRARPPAAAGDWRAAAGQGHLRVLGVVGEASGALPEAGSEAGSEEMGSRGVAAEAPPGDVVDVRDRVPGRRPSSSADPARAPFGGRVAGGVRAESAPVERAPVESGPAGETVSRPSGTAGSPTGRSGAVRVVAHGGRPSGAEPAASASAVDRATGGGGRGAHRGSPVAGDPDRSGDPVSDAVEPRRPDDLEPTEPRVSPPAPGGPVETVRPGSVSEADWPQRRDDWSRGRDDRPGIEGDSFRDPGGDRPGGVWTSVSGEPGRAREAAGRVPTVVSGGKPAVGGRPAAEGAADDPRASERTAGEEGPVGSSRVAEPSAGRAGRSEPVGADHEVRIGSEGESPEGDRAYGRVGAGPTRASRSWWRRPWSSRGAHRAGGAEVADNPFAVDPTGYSRDLAPAHLRRPVLSGSEWSDGPDWPGWSDAGAEDRAREQRGASARPAQIATAEVPAATGRDVAVESGAARWREPEDEPLGDPERRTSEAGRGRPAAFASAGAPPEASVPDGAAEEVSDAPRAAPVGSPRRPSDHREAPRAETGAARDRTVDRRAGPGQAGPGAERPQTPTHPRVEGTAAPIAGARSGPQRKRVARAIATGVVLGGGALAAFAEGPLASTVLVAVVLLFAAGEFYAVLRRAGYRPAALVGLVGTAAAVVAGYLRGPSGLVAVATAVIVLSFLWYLFGVSKGRPGPNVAATLLGFAWVGGLGAFGGMVLDPRAFPHDHGVAYLLGMVIAVVANDVGAYALGAWLGRHRLAPTVSPQKTWEGLVGGSVASLVVGALVVPLIHPWSFGLSMTVAVLVVVLAPLGDLAESMVKRDLGVKDMGSILPGHGGFLDRVDGILFVLPALYYVLVVMVGLH